MHRQTDKQLGRQAGMLSENAIMNFLLPWKAGNLFTNWQYSQILNKDFAPCR